MDTLYTVKTKHIQLNDYSDKFNLWMFGDIHRDTTSCDVDRWKYFISKSKEDDRDTTYYLGLGDYHDFASVSERKRMRKGEIHETTMEKFDQVVQRDIRHFTKEVSHMRGKLLGLVDGNHSWQYMDGKLSVEDMAERLQTEYLGWLTHYTLTFHMPNGSVQSVFIVACHGKAGGKLHGTSINQVADLANVFPMADIYCMGHNHDRGAWPSSVLIPSHSNGNTHIKQKRRFFCRSGSFKRAYMDNTSGYEIGRLLRPADLGALKLTISFHRDRKEGDKIITDINAII